MFNLSEGSFEGTAKNMMVGGKVKFSQSDYNSAIFPKNNFPNICKTPQQPYLTLYCLKILMNCERKC